MVCYAQNTAISSRTRGRLAGDSATNRATTFVYCQLLIFLAAPSSITSASGIYFSLPACLLARAFYNSQMQSVDASAAIAVLLFAERSHSICLSVCQSVSSSLFSSPFR